MVPSLGNAQGASSIHTMIQIGAASDALMILHARQTMRERRELINIAVQEALNAHNPDPNLDMDNVNHSLP